MCAYEYENYNPLVPTFIYTDPSQLSVESGIKKGGGKIYFMTVC